MEAAGFALDNVALIVAGTLVGSSGTILTMEMATAMKSIFPSDTALTAATLSAQIPIV